MVRTVFSASVATVMIESRNDLQWLHAQRTIDAKTVAHYMANGLSSRYFNEGRRLLENVLQANNFCAAYELTDDLAYVLKISGEDNLVIRADYGHADSSSQIDALQRLRDDQAIDRREA